MQECEWTPLKKGRHQRPVMVTRIQDPPMTVFPAVRTFSLTCLLVFGLSLAGWIRHAEAKVTAFMQAVDEGAAADSDIAEL